jgi:selenocysteine-specific elongation factor
MSLAELRVCAGMSDARRTPHDARLASLGITRADEWFVASIEIDAAAARMRAALDSFHGEHPLEPGMSLQAWRGAARADHPVLVALAEASVKGIERDGGMVRRAGWNPGSSSAGLAHQEKLVQLLRDAGGEPPSTAELAAGVPDMDVPAILRLLARGGRIVPVADRYYVKEALDQECERLVSVLRDLGPATPAAIRERMGRSRKWLIPFLEWTDREGLTVRTGDRRALRNVTDA